MYGSAHDWGKKDVATSLEDSTMRNLEKGP